MSSARGLPMVSLGALAFVAHVSSSARADDRAGMGTFLLQLGETSVGSVRAITLAEKPGPAAPNLVLATSDVTPALGAIVDGFASGKPLRTNLRLSTSAVAKKAVDARLASVKLPAMGAGGSPDVELGFLAPSIATQPVLSLKQASARAPSGGRIVAFRVAVTGVPAGATSKLDAIAIAQRADGTVHTTNPEIGFEVAAGGAPPFTSWLKASAQKAAPRSMHVEYVGADGSALLKLQLERCTPTSVTPMGASATTRIVLACASARPG